MILKKLINNVLELNETLSDKELYLLNDLLNEFTNKYIDVVNCVELIKKIDGLKNE